MLRAAVLAFAATSVIAAANPALTALPAPLETRNPPVTWQATAPDAITIAAGAKTNWFVTPWSGKRDDNAPTLLFQPSGDFSLSAKVSLTPKRRWDSGCLTVLTDADNWAKFCLENANGDGKLSAVMVVNKGLSDDGYSDFFAVDNALYLKVSRAGSAFFFNASKDGKSWTMLRAFALGGDPAKLKTGLLAQSPAGDGITVTFTDIRYDKK